MPTIARFYGLVVKMFLVKKEHNPPHIHVIYGEHMDVIEIRSCTVMFGDLPEKQRRDALKWTSLHKEELLEIWNTQTFAKIAPLN